MGGSSRRGRARARSLRSAMERGEFRRWDPDLGACALRGTADFVAMRYVTRGDGVSREPLRDLMEFIHQGLRAPGADGPSVPVPAPDRLPPRRAQ
jgi:hypothetical protein